MANTKITTGNIADGAITSAKLDTSSLAIPSTATATTQTAGDNSTAIATTAYVETAVSNLVDSSPAALDTLNELAAALGDDASFSTTVTNSLALKAPLASPSFTGNVGIGSHLFLQQDNTNDLIKSTGNVLYIKSPELSIQDNSGNERVTITSSGAVGINAPSPNVWNSNNTNLEIGSLDTGIYTYNPTGGVYLYRNFRTNPSTGAFERINADTSALIGLEPTGIKLYHAATGTAGGAASLIERGFQSTTGSFKITSDDDNPLQLNKNTSSTWNYIEYRYQDSRKFYLGTDSANKFVLGSDIGPSTFYLADITKMGINVATPSFLNADAGLHIGGTNAAGIQLSCGGAYAGTGMEVHSDASLRFYQGGQERWRLSGANGFYIGSTKQNYVVKSAVLQTTSGQDLGTTNGVASGVTIFSRSVTTQGNSKLIVWCHSGQILNPGGTSNPEIQIYVDGTAIGYDTDHLWYPLSGISGVARLWMYNMGESGTLSAGSHTISVKGGVYNSNGTNIIFNYQGNPRDCHIWYQEVLV